MIIGHKKTSKQLEVVEAQADKKLEPGHISLKIKQFLLLGIPVSASETSRLLRKTRGMT